MHSRLPSILAASLVALTTAAQTPPTIQIRTLGNEIEASWTDASAVLETSASLAGPWTRLPDALSPHHSPAPMNARFFRLVRGAGGEVVGSLFIAGAGGVPGSKVATPGVFAYLVNLLTLEQSPRVPTDPNGTFILSGRPPGHYQLCWEAPGFVSGCSTQQVAIVDDIVYLAPEAVALQAGGPTHALQGRVQFSDPGPLLLQDAFYDIDFATVVRLESPPGNIIATTRPNSLGQFILTNVPNSGVGQLIATAENLTAQMDVELALHEIGTLTLSNTRPVIAEIVATQGGQPVKRVAPGSTVQLTATVGDADGDALHFLWLPSLHANGFISVDATNVDWTLPVSAGVHQMYLRASDGHGGYAMARVRVSTAPEILFTGLVNDSDGAPVSEAVVSLGTVTALTDTNGSFSFITTNNNPPFIVTITKPGLAPISRVFPDESAGGTFTFIKPQTFLVSSTQDIALTNTQGMELFLPANSLTRGDGLPVVNPVTVAMTSVDPCNSLVESPVGNRAGIGSGGPEIFLSSLSTAHVRLTDATGAELSPAAGTLATLTLPVSSNCASNYAALPPDVGIWSYDLGTGSWSPSGTGVLRASPFGDPPSYQLTVVAANLNNYTAADPSGPISFVNLTCDRSIALPFDVRVTGPSFAFTRTVFTVPSPFAFAPSIAVSFSLLDHRQAPGGHFSDLVTPTATATPDTSKTVNLRANITTPPANGTMTVTLKLGNVLSPLLTKVEAQEAFLKHGYNIGSAATAAAYYAAVDPANARTTLTGFINQNYFHTGEEATTAYFNAGDLGFGRRMHMRRKIGADTGVDVAFYVSNHDTVEHARTGFSPIATVAMEYAYDASYPSHGRYVKFFAYDASGARIDRVNLDNNGDKFLPNLCLVCHGGNHNVTGTAATGWNLNAKFIPFDMESYTYSSVASAKPGAQHNAFRLMNLVIRDNTSPTPAITAMINGWYGVSGTGNFNQNFVPTAWQGASDLPVYRDVVKPSCRACHTTRGLDFATPTGGVDFCGYNVCDIMVMPDAQRTFSIFWGSKTANAGGTGTPPNMPTMLSTRYGANYGTSPCP